MAPILKLFFRYFLVGAITAIVVLKTILTLITQLEHPVIWLLKAFLMFGGDWFFYIQAISIAFLMSLITAIFHIVRFRKFGITKITLADLHPTQHRKVESELDLDILVKILHQDKVLRKMKVTQTTYHSLTLKSGKSRGSWGEIMHVDVTSNNTGTYQYQIVSESRFIINQLSSLKNVENVVRLERLLRSNAGTL